MGNKLLIVFNTCGLGGKNNTAYYVNGIHSILNQNLNGVHIVLSSCLNTQEQLQTLYNIFGNQISYNIIVDKLPCFVTFNHSVKKCVESFGHFDGYTYFDSGCVLNNANDLSVLYKILTQDNAGTVFTRTDTDTGFEWLYKTKDSLGEELFINGDFVVPLGGAANGHICIFSDELFQYYGNIWPDIFAAQCSESTLTFICAALEKKWIISKDVIARHMMYMDGPSSGFSPNEHERKGNKRWDHMFMTQESILDIINRGKEYGMGYEEFQQIVMHNPNKFDENGFATDERLKSYIKDNLFLRKDQFDYSTIRGQFIP